MPLRPVQRSPLQAKELLVAFFTAGMLLPCQERKASGIDHLDMHACTAINCNGGTSSSSHAIAAYKEFQAQMQHQPALHCRHAVYATRLAGFNQYCILWSPPDLPMKACR